MVCDECTLANNSMYNAATRSVAVEMGSFPSTPLRSGVKVIGDSGEPMQVFAKDFYNQVFFVSVICGF